MEPQLNYMKPMSAHQKELKRITLARARILWLVAWSVVALPLAWPMAGKAEEGAEAASKPAGQPIIESIEGDKIVVVKTPEGNKVASKGTAINFGDRVKTGPRASAKIRYPDGSKLIIGRASEMEVQEAENGTQFNEIHSGEVRGLIKKPKIPLGQAAPPRFVIRSKAAVMGVRGTDFVYNLDPSAAKSAVHTLDGLVEVAKTEQALMAGQGVSVAPNTFVVADVASAVIGAAQPFDRADFTKAYESANPEAMALVKADPESLSHQPKPPVQEIEEKKPKKPWFQLLKFQSNGILVRQTYSKGAAVSGELSWNPELRLIWPLKLKGHLGAYPLKGRTLDDTFIGFEAGLLAQLGLLDPLLVEAGVGVSGWGNHGKKGPLAMANVAFKLSEERLLERIFVGVAAYDQETRGQIRPDDPTSGWTNNHNTVLHFKAGVGFQF